jgi:ribose 5-phosphate isomerase B
MRIAIACDHIGFPLKASIVEALEGEEHAVLDLGTHSPDPVDYPPMARAVATAIGKGFVEVGVLVCESAMGGAMAGNRLATIRAAVCQDPGTARESREKLNVNLLCVDAGVESDGAVAIVREWVKAQFSNDERDVRTIAKITEFGKGSSGSQRGSGSVTVSAAPPPSATTSASSPATSASSAASSADAGPKTPDITPVMKVVAAVKDPDTRAIATRILQFLRNRFPTAAGTASEEGFTFTLDGQHVATVTIGKNFVELEAGPDRITTSKVRDADRLDLLLNLPSIVKAFDAIKI